MEITYFERNGNQTAILIAGWPDTADVFADNVVLLLRQLNYRVVGLTLPGYEQRSSSSWQQREARGGYLGYSLEALTRMFKSAVDEIVSSTAPANGVLRRPLLVCHDWGSVLAFECLASHPLMFERVVCLDVAGHAAGDVVHRRSRTNISSYLFGSHAAVEWRKMLFIIAYQVFIIVCFFAQFVPVVADLAIILMAKAGGRPNYRNKDGITVRARADMGYPYIHFWIGMLTRLPIHTVRFFTPVQVPILYLYGEDKPFQFHSNQWLRHIADRGERDGLSRSIAVTGGGHWFFAQPGSTQRDVALRHIEIFLKARPLEC